MKISEVYPEYVFQRLGKGLKVIAVDFKKGSYIDLSGQLVSVVQHLILRADADKDIKFFQLEEAEPNA